jgi:hypothetical protein
MEMWLDYNQATGGVEVKSIKIRTRSVQNELFNKIFSVAVSIHHSVQKKKR